MRQRRLCGRFHPLQRYVRLAISDVVTNRIVEQERLLRHRAHQLPQGGDGGVAQVVAVDGDGAGRRIEKTWD